MTTVNEAPARRFRHEALLYADEDDFVAQTMPIIGRAVEAEEPVLVAVDSAKIELLRARLGEASHSVSWKDIRGIGRNPATIIPIWRQFVASHPGERHLWGVGEPVWSGRTSAELVESQRHELLLNLAFANTLDFTLLCPYNTGILGPEVIAEAHRSHPFVSGGDRDEAKGGHDGNGALLAQFDTPLPAPPGKPQETMVGDLSPAGLRRFLLNHATKSGLGEAQADRLTLAVAAVAGGMGRPGRQCCLRVWREDDAAVAEVDDLRRCDDPLAGREWPPRTEGGVRGLWLANQLCDLVQVRSSSNRTTVRLRVAKA